MAAHRPERGAPDTGCVGGERGAGSTDGVAMDGAFRTWVRRRDPCEDPAEMAALESAHGRPVAPPGTWAGHTEVAAFVHRPDRGLSASTDRRSQGWRSATGCRRSVSADAPNLMPVGEDGTPPIDGPEGVMAPRASVASLAPHAADAISWGSGRRRRARAS